MSTVSSLSSAQVSTQIAQAQARLQKPITNLNNQVSTDKAIISAWGTISGAVSNLTNALAGIKDVSSINNRTTSVSNDAVATATAAIGAQIGTYNLTNVSLAKTQEIYSALQSSANAALSGGAGSLNFTLNSGQTETVQVGSGSLTLNGIAAAINKQQGGVQASIVSTAAGARLVLQSSATGSSQAFSVAGTGALAQFSYSSGSAGSEVLAQQAADASLSINGVPVTNPTNALGSAISGVALTLTGSGSTVVTVGSASTAFANAVSSVANNLNTAISTIAKAIKFVPPSNNGSASGSSKGSAGPLLGNFTATNLSNRLLSAVSGAVASGLSAKSIGLSVDATGTVSFDSSTFAEAYASNPNAVQTLVSQLYTNLDQIGTSAIGSSGSAGGAIGAQTDSLQASITSLNGQISQISKYNNAQLSILIQQYTLAENNIAKASISQAYLSIFLGSNSSSSSG